MFLYDPSRIGCHNESIEDVISCIALLVKDSVDISLDLIDYGLLREFDNLYKSNPP